jgi:diacylglycerol kinase family enzyme
MTRGSSSKKHLFVINPRSFLTSRDINRIIREIASCFGEPPEALQAASGDISPGLPALYSPESPYAIHISRFPRDAIIVIRKYMAMVGEETSVRVYAIGGDGVVFCCLNGIAGLPNAELAVVPYGTGSDFVQAFGGKELIPGMRNIAEQIKAPTIYADIIDCGSMYALNACAVGLEPMSLLKAYPLLKACWKLRRRSIAITEMILRFGGLAAVFDAKTIGQYYHIRMDDEEIEGPLSIIHLANTPGYPINKTVIPEAVPDDGLLDMLVYRQSSPVRILRRMPRYLKGRHAEFPNDYIYRRVRSVAVRSDRPLCITLDGEVFFDTSITVRVLPQAVRIASVGGRPFKNESLSYGTCESGNP